MGLRQTELICGSLFLCTRVREKLSCLAAGRRQVWKEENGCFLIEGDLLHDEKKVERKCIYYIVSI